MSKNQLRINRAFRFCLMRGMAGRKKPFRFCQLFDKIG